MGLFFEDLAPGMSAEATHEVHEADVRAFAAVSGDVNPLHLDEAFAAKTQFGARIAHGILTASYISALIGTQLPGPGAVYVSQTLYFKRPVKLGDTVHARVEITALDDKGHATFKCRCTVNRKTVLEGEAVALAPRRPAAA